jgi:hypothetical protein
MEWSNEVEAAEWIVRRLHPFASDVGSLVPEDFAAYVRILHPARGPDGESLRWADLAREAGVELHPALQFESLVEEARARAVDEPSRGTLEPEELDALTEILARHTGRPDRCWFSLWDGYGWLQGPPAVAGLARRRGLRRRPADLPDVPHVPAGTARVEIPHRALLLYEGPVDAAAAFVRYPMGQSPNLWWPDDRGWCVASEIDFDSTYVGGSEALAGELLHDERLEVLPAAVTDPINPAGLRAQGC